jgi:hypothetical protein
MCLTADSDFFYITQQSNHERTLCIVLSITSIAIGTPFFYLMIQFERNGSDLKRTLLNRLTSMFLFSGLTFGFTVQVLEIWRFIFGPMFLWVCFAQVNTLSSKFIVSILLFLKGNNYKQISNNRALVNTISFPLIRHPRNNLIFFLIFLLYRMLWGACSCTFYFYFWMPSPFLNFYSSLYWKILQLFKMDFGIKVIILSFTIIIVNTLNKCNALISTLMQRLLHVTYTPHMWRH